MGKLFLLILFAVLVYLVLMRGRPLRAGRASAAPRAAEAMIRCAHCQTHVPLGESLPDGEQRYCCEEHRRLGRR